MKSHRFITLVFVGTLSLVAPSFAQSAGSAAATNSGGTTNSVRSGATRGDLSQQFSAIDSNGDGRISHSEFANFSTPSTINDTRAGPTNRSGAPGAGESSLSGQTGQAISGGAAAGGTTTGWAPAGAAAPSSSSSNTQLFVQLDTNRDGYLNREELSASGAADMRPNR